MEESPAKVLVIVVTYQGEGWLKTCLGPFVEDREGLDIFVIDNDSKDDTCRLIEERYPFVHLYKAGTNLGFGAANNIGLEFALANDYRGVFLLNQDASISRDTILEMAHLAEQNPDFGILSPVHLGSPDGDPERGFKDYLPQDFDHYTEEIVPIRFVNAALWYIPQRSLQMVGLFSPLFRHYGEDLDYSNRLHNIGLKMGICRTLSAYHLRSLEPPSPSKAAKLEEVYHLAQWINPLLTPRKQYWQGPGLLLAKYCRALSLGNSTEAHRYLRAYRDLLKRRGERNLWIKRPPYSIDDLQRVYKEGTNLSPVALFVFNRPDHTRRILTDLQRQAEAPFTDIYIFGDGARSPQEQPCVEEVRRICREARGFHSIHYHFQEHNIGLAGSITSGVDQVLQHHDRVIVLEDDLVLSPYALRWINDALRRLQDCEGISHINLSTFYTHPSLPRTFLSHYIGSWGWATWKKEWEKYWEPDGKKLLKEFESNRNLAQRFDYDGTYGFVRMLRRQTQGLNQSWAVRWHASLVLHGRLSYNVNPPLVSNAGFDGSGTHCANDGQYATSVAPYPIYADLPSLPLKELPLARKVLTRYYLRTNNKAIKGWNKLKDLYRNRFTHR